MYQIYFCLFIVYLQIIYVYDVLEKKKEKEIAHSAMEALAHVTDSEGNVRIPPEE